MPTVAGLPDIIKRTAYSIVLVHGAWHGGWCWQRITSGLSAKGHRVFTPTLTGLGERVHLASPEINLDTHIQDVVNVIKSEELSDVILVGHSYAGMVITGVADKLAGAIKKLIYLDAFVPEHGNSLIDFFSAEIKAGVSKEGEATGYVKPLPVSVFGISNSEDQDWVTRRMVAQPYATLAQPLNLSRGIGNIPRSYIYCSTPPSGSFTQFAMRFKADPTWTYHELKTGHDCMIISPDDLIRTLCKEL